MSAILSADDLNDFISPGVACIKPVETLPKQQAQENAYEVTTEDKVAAAEAPPASISLTDCLACSGCVTSAEAVLVSLQSHQEVLNTLDAYPELRLPWTAQGESLPGPSDGKVFVASVSPQTRASIAATYRVSETAATNMIQQLLSGPAGLRSGGANNSGFAWIIDTNAMRQAALVAAADEVMESQHTSDSSASRAEKPKKPILTSACPGWICYAEKTHPHALPHMSRLKSPQALTGTLVKSVLARKYGINPENVWHMAIMPCFDKKLEASREELTDIHWSPDGVDTERKGIRDVDCVITARELLMLAESRDISFPQLSQKPLSSQQRTPFPDPKLDRFLFPSRSTANGSREAGTSGGYLWHVLETYRAQHPGSQITIQRGRNADVVEYTLVDSEDAAILRTARYYGFRNIQNLVRRLKPARASRMPGAASRLAGARKPGAAAGSAGGQNMSDYAYVEVMACPGGCTNGGGQIKVGDVGALRGSGIENGGDQQVAPQQKEWLQKVDEAYFSSSDSGSPSASDTEDEGVEDVEASSINTTAKSSANGDVEMEDAEDGSVVGGISHSKIKDIFSHWSELTGVSTDKLVYTSYRKVESDVGKTTTDVERVAGLASTIGGGCLQLHRELKPTPLLSNMLRIKTLLL
ncbi:putative iron-sulfur cluster assembly associated protein Nar1 [Aureobasidium subglaciale]|nr:putative iron-sulfur cluster assembly associated protein Nar1 [Aureobasidium subglaciale]